MRVQCMLRVSLRPSPPPPHAMSGRPTPDHLPDPDDEQTELGAAPTGAPSPDGARRRPLPRAATEELPIPSSHADEDEDDEETTAAVTMPLPRAQPPRTGGRRTVPIEPPRTPEAKPEPRPERGERTEPLPRPALGDRSPAPGAPRPSAPPIERARGGPQSYLPVGARPTAQAPIAPAARAQQPGTGLGSKPTPQAPVVERPRVRTPAPTAPPPVDERPSAPRTRTSRGLRLSTATRSGSVPVRRVGVHSEGHAARAERRPEARPPTKKSPRKRPGVAAAPLGFTIPRDPLQGLRAAQAHVSDRDWAGSALENAVQGSRDDDERTAAEPVPFEAPPVWLAVRQRPGLWAVGVLLLLALVGGTIWRVVELRREDEARLEKARNDAQPPWLRKSNRPEPPPPPPPPR